MVRWPCLWEGGYWGAVFGRGNWCCAIDWWLRTCQLADWESSCSDRKTKASKQRKPLKGCSVSDTQERIQMHSKKEHQRTRRAIQLLLAHRQKHMSMIKISDMKRCEVVREAANWHMHTVFCAALMEIGELSNSTSQDLPESTLCRSSSCWNRSVAACKPRPYERRSGVVHKNSTCSSHL